ncbi:MAG: DUF4373 domain-containing protein [Fusobacteriaceae bacterium]
MARPVKKGMEYFSHDVSLSDDKKVRLLEKKCGYVGYAVFIKLLEEIYKEEGYYLKVVEEELECCFQLLEIEEVVEIIEVCLDRNLFDRDKFEKYKILTSSRIQKNYIAGTGRRTAVKMKKEYIIVDSEYAESEVDSVVDGINVDNNLVNVCNNSINVDSSTQTKVNKSKVNNNIEKKPVVDVSSDNLKDFESALRVAKNKDGITNPEGYARNMLKNGFTAEQELCESKSKGLLSPGKYARWIQAIEDGIRLSDHQYVAVEKYEKHHDINGGKCEWKQ